MTAEMTRPRLGHRSRLFVVCCATMMLAGLWLAAPSKATIWWENSQVTVTGDAPGFLVTIDQDQSDQLLVIWRGPFCNVDLNGNSQTGGPMDRAVCALNAFRNSCPHGWWPPKSLVAGVICDTVSTYHEWRDVDAALWRLLDPQPAAPDCLAVALWSTVDGPWNWTDRNISTQECESV
jgi:hypothetical protein